MKGGSDTIVIKKKTKGCKLGKERQEEKEGKIDLVKEKCMPKEKLKVRWEDEVSNLTL